MYQRVAAELQTRADLLLAGRLEELAGRYLLPQAIYFSDAPWVLSTTDQVVAALDRLHRIQRDRQILTCTAQVTALELPRRGRFRAWVRWYDCSADPNLSTVSDGVYYLRETAGGVRNEMLELPFLSRSEFREAARLQRLIA